MHLPRQLLETIAGNILHVQKGKPAHLRLAGSVDGSPDCHIFFFPDGEFAQALLKKLEENCGKAEESHGSLIDPQTN